MKAPKSLSIETNRGQRSRAELERHRACIDRRIVCLSVCLVGFHSSLALSPRVVIGEDLREVFIVEAVEPRLRGVGDDPSERVPPEAAAEPKSDALHETGGANHTLGHFGIARSTAEQSIDLEFSSGEMREFAKVCMRAWDGLCE